VTNPILETATEELLVAIWGLNGLDIGFNGPISAGYCRSIAKRAASLQIFLNPGNADTGLREADPNDPVRF